MRRLLINGVMTALLIVCLATSVLWIRSYVRVDLAQDTDMWREGENWYWRDRIVRSERGGVRLRIWGCLLRDPGFAEMQEHKPGQRSITAHGPGELGPGLRFPDNLWFDFDRRVRFAPIGSFAAAVVIHMDRLSVHVPYWPIVVLSGLPPAVWLTRRRRVKRRIARGQCLRCGYDLRETPDRCPECGQLAPDRQAGAMPDIG